MMRNEVKYRLAKWLVGDMLHKCIISHQTSAKIIDGLLELYDPPFRCLEYSDDEIGDGINIADKNDWLARSSYRGRMYCDNCGAYFGPKPIHSNDKYRKVLWVCRQRWRNNRCDSKVIIHDTELVEALHKSARKLLLSYGVDKDVGKIAKDVLSPADYILLQQWIEDWIKKDIRWCISDESDMLIILDSIIVKQTWKLDFLFIDSSRLEYQLRMATERLKYDSSAKKC